MDGINQKLFNTMFSTKLIRTLVGFFFIGSIKIGFALFSSISEVIV